MKELIFEVTDDLEGGYVASALGVGIHTQAESVDELKAMVRDAVECYYDERDEKPSLIRLHFVRDEVMAV
ncbi:MAG: type II toxin-antitoxin system HicB family antitoxin [Opitutales bacterium]